MDVRSRLEQLGSLLAEVVHYSEALEQSPLDMNLIRYRKTMLELKIEEVYPGRFGNLNEAKYLEIGVTSAIEASSLVPDDSPVKGNVLNRLGISYWTRYKGLDNLVDLAMAIECHSQAMELPHDPTMDPNEWLYNLGSLHQRMFERQHDPSALDASIGYQTQALAQTGPSHPLKPHILRVLADLSNYRFELLGRLADLQSAITYLEQVISLFPEGGSLVSEYLPGDLGNLGNAYRNRFTHIGDLSDLDVAINCFHRGLLLERGIGGRILLLGGLGNAYDSRFEYSRDTADHVRSIDYKSQAVQNMSNDDPEKHTLLCNLGNSYIRSFVRDENLADFDNSILNYERALKIAEDVKPEDIVYCLVCLGGAYTLRFSLLEDRLNDPKTAIDFTSRALQLIGKEDPMRCRCLCDLGAAYRMHFRVSRSLDDLSMASEQLEECLSLTPDVHPDKTKYLLGLGDIFSDRFHSSGKDEWLHRSIDCYMRAAQSATGSPEARFKATTFWANLALGYDGCESTVASINQQILALIPQVVWLGNRLSYRHEKTKEITFAIGQSVPAALELHKYGLAVAWLEAGRSIIWSQTLQLRTPLDDLRAHDPVLATKLQDIAQSLDHASLYKPNQLSALLDEPNSEQVVQRNHCLAQDWDKLLSQVRQISGFESFLKPKTMSDYQKRELKSTLVLIGTHTGGGYAISITSDWKNMTCIPLPALTLQKAAELRQKIMNWMQGKNVRGGKERRLLFPEADEEYDFENIMAEMWEDIVGPVLGQLGFLVRKVIVDYIVGFSNIFIQHARAPEKPLPRLTWYAMGPLASLPLHASGRYDELYTRTYNYVISSYTPTLGALLKPRAIEFRGILGVGQESTTGCTPLPETVTELNQLEKQAHTVTFMRLDGSAATATAVLSAMKQYSWIHFACHASQNISNPIGSAFHLSDGQLDLATLAQESLDHAELAFLSACETATGDDELPDEAIHLAAGMLMIGYRAVIATLWSIKDDDAPKVTERFYSRLLKNGSPNVEMAAEALHDAVGCLRNEVGEKAFARWAPFVHFGQ